LTALLIKPIKPSATGRKKNRARRSPCFKPVWVMPGKPLTNCNYKLHNKPGANPWQSAVTPGKFLAGKFEPLKSRESLHYAEDLTKF